MALWVTQLFGLLFVIGAVAFLSFILGYQVRKDEEQHG